MVDIAVEPPISDDAVSARRARRPDARTSGQSAESDPPHSNKRYPSAVHPHNLLSRTCSHPSRCQQDGRSVMGLGAATDATYVSDLRRTGGSSDGGSAMGPNDSRAVAEEHGHLTSMLSLCWDAKRRGREGEGGPGPGGAAAAAAGGGGGGGGAAAAAAAAAATAGAAAAAAASAVAIFP
ncbi:hypothetical protein M433DRAFT_131842 [Acidomyces richmondensis BFW]|nr:MAG: hypothetical protein FE78DRAFT_226258 [Acidomyces sp. 'richmondensis']KYG48734.1 hypothetical protein M433DRAFT_131842 [Acidomyces richmondensis BFW]